MNVLFIESGPGNRMDVRSMVTRMGHVHRGIIYEIHKVTPENREALRNEAYPFEAQFGYPSRWLIHRKVTHYIQDGTEVTLAIKPRSLFRGARTVGICTEELKRVSVGDEKRKISHLGIRVVLPKYQKHGIGTHCLEASAVRNDPDAYTGQTRVYGIIDLYRYSPLIHAVAPFTKPMSADIEETLKGSLDRITLEETDLTTGVRKKAFPPSSGSKEDLKRFNPPKNNPRGIATRREMGEKGVDPLNGDVIRYYAETNHEAIRLLREKGIDVNTVITYETEAVLAWVPRMVASLLKFRLPR